MSQRYLEPSQKDENVKRELENEMQRNVKTQKLKGNVDGRYKGNVQKDPDLCFRNFPKGTIHIVLVSSYVKQYKDHLLITKSDGHVFLSLNNGFPNFLFPKSKYLCYVNDDIDKLCTNSVVNAYTQACILLKKSIEYNFEKLNAPRIIQKGGIVKQQDVLMGQIVL